MIQMSSLGFLCVPRLTCASRVLLYGGALKEATKSSASVKNVTTLLVQCGPLCGICYAVHALSFPRQRYIHVCGCRVAGARDCLRDERAKIASAPHTLTSTHTPTSAYLDSTHVPYTYLYTQSWHTHTFTCISTGS